MPVASPAISHMDAETLRQQVLTLKAEMESIRLASVDCLQRKGHTSINRKAHEVRTTRLEEIVSELAAMTRKNAKNG
jgi:hypothetical protein